MRLRVGATIGEGSDEAIIRNSRHAGRDLQALRGHNRGTIFKILLDSPGGCSISDLHRATSLSRPTVELVLAELVTTDLVMEIEHSASTARGGRRARRFAIESQLGLVAGAVIGLERVELVLCDLHGNIVARTEQACIIGDASRGQLRNMLEELLRGPDIKDRKLNVLTIGVIGFVDGVGQIHRYAGDAGMTRHDYQSIISDDIGCPVFIENDANLAATAEYTHLGQHDIRDVIGLHADVAIGCGLVIDGKLHRGFGGTAGELGFYKELGWQDTDGIVRAAAAARNVTVRDLYRQAGQGIKWAETVTRQFALNVAPGVLAMVLTINPQMVIIGGAISAAGDVFRAPLEEYVTSHAPSPPQMIISDLGPDCIAMGALIQSLNYFKQELEERARFD